jgi:hypothetical protein
MKGDVKLDGEEILRSECFRYFESIIHKDEEIEEDVNYRIRVGWMKWRSALGVFCDRRIPIKLKGDFYKTTIKLAMFYGIECWVIKKQYVHKMSVTVFEMRMLGWIS